MIAERVALPGMQLHVEGRAIRAGSALVVAGVALLGLAASAAPDTHTTTFAVMRDDTQIGTNTISVARNGADTTVESVTHIEVKLGFVTLYRFDQKETERWTDGRFLSMDSTTDDNGTLHKTDAKNTNGSIAVKGDGHACEVAAGTFPLSPWNAAVVAQNHALDPRDGSFVNVTVEDRGEDTLLLHGRSTRAHHYFVRTTYAQDLWYDDSSRLVKLEFKGSDGSTILYKLV